MRSSAHAQGFAYVEFLEVDAVDNALLLDNSEVHGRHIKVMSTLVKLAARVGQVKAPKGWGLCQPCSEVGEWRACFAVGCSTRGGG
jgi:hypothetical protein